MKIPVVGIVYVINSEEEIVWRSPSQKKAGLAVEMLDSLLKTVSGDYKVKLYLYDTCCTKKTKEFIRRYQKKENRNITIQSFDCKGQSIYACYNAALELPGIDWINFMKATSFYAAESIQAILKDSEKYAASVMSLVPYQEWNGERRAQLYFKKRNCVLDLKHSPFYLNYCLDSLFIKRNVIQNLRFEEKYSYDTTEFFLIQLYEQVERYALLGNPYFCLMTEELPTDPYNYEAEFDKEWYTASVKNTYSEFLSENPSSIIRQAGLVYQIELKFWANGNDRDKAILSKEEQEEFYRALRDFFQKIPDSVLSQYHWTHKRVLQRFMGMNFLRLKYDNYDMKGHVEASDQTPVVVTEQHHVPVDTLETAVFNIMAINYENETLTFDGELGNVYYADYDNLFFWAEIGKKKVQAVRNEIYSLEKYFGMSVKKGYMVQISIPEKLIKNGSSLVFKMEYEGSVVSCKGSFKKLQSRFDDNYPGYWRFGSHILSLKGLSPLKMTVEKNSLKNFVKKEIQFQKVLHSKHAMIFRPLYFLTRPLFRHKKIWITFDQLFKGGDNGEYFFRHVNEQHRNEVDMYYVVNPNTKEYENLKKNYGKVLKYKSLWLRLVALNADMIFATRVGIHAYLGFDSDYQYFIRDLFHADVVCLQHGLTIQKIAQYQNRLFDNLKYYFCVSPYEIENIMQPIYGYTRDMISLTGAPRYDGLAAVPKRQILITPTWRRNVTAGTNKKGSNHEYSVNFKRSVYYQIYNTLINDERLIACAKRTNYKLIYLIHPILSPQADDFDKNEYVEIRPGVDVNYETILKESSLMVTDYSGIQFDFAYMRRPLIYYHPEQLPPQYDEGNLKYDTMGFGPICRTNDEIVEQLCYFMERDCKLDEKYRERIEDFFPYEDQNNCERVYQAAVAWEQKKKNTKKRKFSIRKEK